MLSLEKLVESHESLPETIHKEQSQADNVEDGVVLHEASVAAPATLSGKEDTLSNLTLEVPDPVNQERKPSVVFQNAALPGGRKQIVKSHWGGGPNPTAAPRQPV